MIPATLMKQGKRVDFSNVRLYSKTVGGFWIRRLIFNEFSKRWVGQVYDPGYVNNDVGKAEKNQLKWRSVTWQPNGRCLLKEPPLFPTEDNPTRKPVRRADFDLDPTKGESID